MFKKFGLGLVWVLFAGCAALTVNEPNAVNTAPEEVLPCEKKAKVKSLQLLEQQYRCTGKQ